MSQLIINLTPELQKKVEEYVEDCDDAERIEREIDSGKMKTYSWQEVRERLALAK